MAVMRCKHVDPIRGRCTRPAHQTSEHRYATGGVVRGPADPGDDRIPAMLSAGHIYMPAGAVERYGSDLLAALNEPGTVAVQPDRLTRVLDWIHAHTGYRPLPWQREVLRQVYDDDPDGPPWRAVADVAACLAGAGIAGAVLYAIMRRHERGGS